ncbi:hypothetical protein Kisp01_28720 [Kineosporia sp. NBRC 101677]|uniref:hypothetical protein n=1 Tax=Kineosporia sp. NBRC 101677 TaxID=3032197 RepID=UPI0024A157F9|nr:hypothetical protein [Kineosporia sp. NBRC 101677]GLY15857.1 hypothetical protein Kisp01_28720 [Kineosporia sp. NBRC 101677]
MPTARPAVRPRLRRGVAATLTALVLAACTGSPDPQPRARLRSGAAEPYAGLKPREILELAEQNFTEARSAQVQISFDEGDGPQEYDLRAGRNGQGRGEMTDPAGGLLKIKVVDGIGYLLPSSSLLDELAGDDQAVRRELRGRWLEAPLDHDPDWGGTFDVLDLGFLLDDLIGVTSDQRNLLQVKGKIFDGRKTIGIRRKNLRATLYVSADGSGELVASVDAGTRAVFSHWNEKIQVKVPALTYPLEATGSHEEVVRTSGPPLGASVSTGSAP